MPQFEIVERQALLPEFLPHTSLDMIPLDVIEVEELGPPPRPELIRSIRALGVQTPITVQQNSAEHWQATGLQYRLIAGRRRLLASAECGFETIPALIYPVGEINVMLLTDHAQRHANPAAELQAIQNLQEAGYDEKQIAQATGMTVGTIRNRLRLLNLCAEFREAFDSGDITLQVAEGLLKLSPEIQTELAVQYMETGVLTAKDVKDARRVARADSVGTLDFGDDSASTDDSEPVDSGSSLDQFITMVGANPTNPRDLASVGIACIDTGRWDDARTIFERIMELQP